jgi:hypothetical protein
MPKALCTPPSPVYDRVGAEYGLDDSLTAFAQPSGADLAIAGRVALATQRAGVGGS